MVAVRRVGKAGADSSEMSFLATRGVEMTRHEQPTALAIEVCAVPDPRGIPLAPTCDTVTGKSRTK